MMAGAANDIGIAADFRCASGFTIGIEPMGAQQARFYTALLKLTLRDDPSLEDATPQERALAIAALWQSTTPPPSWRPIYADAATALAEITRRALPRTEATRSLLLRIGRSRLSGFYQLLKLVPGSTMPDAATAVEAFEMLLHASSSAAELSLPAARLCDEAIARVIPELAADSAASESSASLLSAAAKLLGRGPATSRPQAGGERWQQAQLDGVLASTENQAMVLQLQACAGDPFKAAKVLMNYPLGTQFLFGKRDVPLPVFRKLIGAPNRKFPPTLTSVQYTLAQLALPA